MIDFAFIIATVLPIALALGVWYVLWRRSWWLRVPMVLLAIAIAFVAGKWAMFTLIDVAYPNTRSPGIGVVAVPMTLFLAMFSVLFVFVEVSRLASKRARRRPSE